MIDPGGGPKKDRCLIFFRKCKGLLNHGIGLFYGAGIEDRNLGIGPEGPGILLGLGGDGAGIVRHEDHHASLYPDVFQAHQGVRGHIQTYLLHGH